MLGVGVAAAAVCALSLLDRLVTVRRDEREVVEVDACPIAADVM
jgi:hypothetical protein